MKPDNFDVKGYSEMEIKSFLPYDPFKTVRRATMIDSVEVEKNGGLRLKVSGFHLDGSGVPVKVEQHRTGEQVKVRIYREWDYDAICPANLLPYQDTIHLEGKFDHGNYVIDVNHRIVEVTL